MMHARMHRVALGLSIGLLVATVVVSCAERRDWTPYTVPDQKLAIYNGEEVPADSVTRAQRLEESAGCVSCHEAASDPHITPTGLGCVDCHGGNGRATEKEAGHPKAKHPEAWPENGANPQRSYALLNDENLD